MSPRLHHVVLLVLIPAWLCFFALSLRDTLGGTAYPSLRLQFSATEPYPHVLGSRDTHKLPGAAQAGDRLLSWDGHSLAHVGPLGYYALVATKEAAAGAVPIQLQRGNERLVTKAALASYSVFLPRVVSAPVFLIVALILSVRMPRGSLRRNLVGCLLAVAWMFVLAFANPPWMFRVSVLVQLLSASALGYCGVRAFLIFPHGEDPENPVVRALPWPFLLLGPLEMERAIGHFISQDIANTLEFVLLNCANAIILLSLAINYRAAQPSERRKIKWVLWGAYLAAMIPASAGLAAMFSPLHALRYYAATASAVVIPIALLIAVLRYDLFDINKIVGLTAVYSIVGGLTLIGSLAAAPHLASFVASAMSLPQSVAELCLCSVMGTTLVLMHRRVAPYVERASARGRATLESAFEQLVAQLEAATSANSAIALICKELQRLLRVEAIAFYWRGQDAKWRMFLGSGRGVSAPVENSEFLNRALRKRRPIILKGSHPEGGRPTSGWDRALADAMNLHLALPVVGSSSVGGVLCLAGKTSGDIYLRTEVTLLVALCQLLSARLSRFELTELIDCVRREQGQLQRYVPGAVVESFASRGAVETGERDITVMFVDIRGYSTLAEGHNLPSLFMQLSEYTLAVSGVIRKHRGHVVEFNGDGMMAVFGAPDSLACKEDAALQSADEILESVLLVDLAGRAGVSVGVGIASGRAYVGTLRSADRDIWTAIGETTNRAARLQALTRELHASIIVDESTFLALRKTGYELELRRNQVLRGLLRRHNLFVRPLQDSVLTQPDLDSGYSLPETSA